MPPPTAWPAARLHVVTGKGGTGKTTVAAALALSMARGGRRVLLVEVEERQGIAQLFDTAPLPYEERRVAVTEGGGEVRALAIDVEAALLEYLEMFYNLKRAGRALRRMGAVDFATAIAPGLRDVLLTGKMKEAVTRQVKGARAYDAVVVDAPPTGRIARFLSVTKHVAGLAKGGPIKTQSDGVMAVLRSSQTAIHIVTVLEDMPVQESRDAVGELRAVGLPVGSIIVNMARRPLLPRNAMARAATRRLDATAIAASLTGAGLDGDALAGPLLLEGADHALGWQAQEACRARVRDLGRLTYELPELPGPIDIGSLYELADTLTRAGIK
ncbi:MAG: AAA family ATPase [Actinomycetota bacterium]|nr:AAA family ATPase [Actinomycetota bacterium]